MKLFLIRIRLIFSLISIISTVFLRLLKEIAAYVKAKQFSKLRKFLLSINGFRFLDPVMLPFEKEEITWFGISEESHSMDLGADYSQDESTHKSEKVIAGILQNRNSLWKDANHDYEKGNWKGGNIAFLKADRLEDEASRILNIDPLAIRILGANFTSSIGHISFGFGLRAKMMALSCNPVKRYLVLPQRDSNLTYLKYWQSIFQTLDISPRKSAEIERTFWFLQESISSVRISETGSQDLINAHNFYSLEWEKQKRPPLLQLSDLQNEYGKKFLRQNLGLNDQDWFVTVHVRDDVLSQTNYGRNADIASYLPAFQYIIDQGGYVVRIGGKDSKKLPKIPGLLDYAHFPEKLRMMDIFFLAKAKFMIATTSGPIGVASSFGTPILWTNAPDIGKAVFHPKSLLIPKLILNKKRETISMTEILSSPLGYIDSQIRKLEREDGRFQGYTWRNNSEVEIINGVREMIDDKFKVITPKQRDFISLLESYGNSGSTKVVSAFLEEWEGVMYS